jgi:hypothetical protein
MLLAGTLLAFSLLGVGCKQGIGDRCEVDTDCSEGTCNRSSGDQQNGICCIAGTSACNVNSGAGGSVASIGGNTGSGGAGTGGAGGAANDAGSDGPGDASTTD